MSRLLLVIPLILLAGCAAPVPGSGSGSVVDARSTISSAQATADSSATRSVEMAIGTARAVEAAAIAAQDTRTALSARETAIALDFKVSEATRTAKADMDIATSEASISLTAEAQRVQNFEIARRDTERRLAQESARYTVVTVLLGLGLALVVLCVALAGVAFAWRIYYVSRNPIISAPDGYRGPFMFQNPFSGVTVLDQPALPTGEHRRALTVDEVEDGEYEAQAPVPPLRELPIMADSHIIVVGETTTGKSGVLRALIKQRPGDVYVVDPHYRPGSWPQNVREIVGVAGDYKSAEDLMLWLGDELASRIRRRSMNDVSFSAVTVVMDEQPDLNKKVTPEALDYWKDVVRQGAKYALYVLMGTQSMLVKEMGIEGESSVLRNFEYRVLMGSFAIEKVPALEPLGNRAAVVVQSRRAPVPVSIPYAAHEDPRSPAFRPHGNLPPVNAGIYRGSAVVRELFGDRAQPAPVNVGPMIMLPMPDVPATPTDPRRDGMFTARGWVDPARVRRILEGRDRGLPHYKIEQHAFDDRHGGAFYYMVEEVLAHFGLDTVQRASTSSTD